MEGRKHLEHITFQSTWMGGDSSGRAPAKTMEPV